MLQFIKQLGQDFLNLVFPNLCLGCRTNLQTGEVLLCVHCRLALPLTNQHHELKSPLLTKFSGKVPIDFVLAYLYFSKGGITQKLLHQIKYKGQKEAGKLLGQWYGEELKNSFAPMKTADYLVGVPLHKSRQQQRGYNQSDWIGEGFSEATGVPYRNDVLIRTRFEGSQTRRNRLQRYENVKAVFVIESSADIVNKRIVLIDDVLTTGATLEACANELLRAGCLSVGIVTIAATRY